MITGISIENFKGIGEERVEIDLRPITLFYGANSAGKSSVIHALHYVREILERHNVNPDQTLAGGEHLNLGGFAQLVHNQDTKREIKIRIDASLPDGELSGMGGRVDEEGEEVPFVNELSTVGVQLSVAWSAQEEVAYVASTSIFLDGEFFAELIGGPRKKTAALTGLVRDHDSLASPADLEERQVLGDDAASDGTEEVFQTYLSEALDEMPGFILGTVFSPMGTTHKTGGQSEQTLATVALVGSDGLPSLDQPLQWEVNQNSLVPRLQGDESAEKKEKHGEAVKEFKRKHRIAEDVMNGLSELVLGSCRFIRDCLKDLRYLGPVRESPASDHQPPLFPDESRWSNGLRAWDLLHEGSDALVDAVGNWLADPDNLDSGFSLERRRFYEIDLEQIQKLRKERAFVDVDQEDVFDWSEMRQRFRIVFVPVGTELGLRPQDIGTGTARVIPLLVAALHSDNKLLVIEEPEQNQHPEYQARMGDLLIDSKNKHDNSLLLETHSEHMILRLQRRIRETTKGTAPADRQLKCTDLAVYWFQSVNGATEVRSIDVDVNGEFIQPWPDDFFEIDFYERSN